MDCAYDTDRFSSRSIVMSNVRPPQELAPVGAVPPISSDPPFHHGARKVLVIDREVNQHGAFGLGIHRCVGSHLARMELRVALEVWLQRFPVFALDDAAAVSWAPGQVRGPRTLPLRVG